MLAYNNLPNINSIFALSTVVPLCVLSLVSCIKHSLSAMCGLLMESQQRQTHDCTLRGDSFSHVVYQQR